MEFELASLQGRQGSKAAARRRAPGSRAARVQPQDQPHRRIQPTEGQSKKKHSTDNSPQCTHVCSSTHCARKRHNCQSSQPSRGACAQQVAACHGAALPCHPTRSACLQQSFDTNHTCTPMPPNSAHTAIQSLTRPQCDGLYSKTGPRRDEQPPAIQHRCSSSSKGRTTPARASTRHSRRDILAKRGGDSHLATTQKGGRCAPAAVEQQQQGGVGRTGRPQAAGHLSRPPRHSTTPQQVPQYAV